MDTKIQCELCENYFKFYEVSRIIDYKYNDSKIVCHYCIEREPIDTTLSYSELQSSFIKKIIEKDKLKKLNNMTLLKPHEIEEQLNECVIGQEEAKRTISVALFNHTRRSRLKTKTNKSNVLLVGPTGCGKTHIIKKACEITGLPYVIEDATSITEAGYSGTDVHDILKDLVVKCDQDIDKAQRGIIYIDEFDKLAKKKSSRGDKDVSGEGSQQALLKMTEGSIISVKGKRFEEDFDIDTSKILFIFSGAFVGIEDIVSNRIGSKKSIGFEKNIKKEELSSNRLSKNLTVDDIISFGMIPELVGRIPLITAIKKLTTKQLVEIMTDCKDSVIDEYKTLFKLDDIKLSFSKKALTLIAESTQLIGTGARGLNSIVEKTMIDVVYHVQKSEKTIKKIVIQEKNIKKVLDI